MATCRLDSAPQTPLGEALAARIRRDGPLPFEAFMESCLYDARFGYYAGVARVIGRRGDFFTSVSVGPVFGELVAAWIAGSWSAMGSPRRFRLVEQGAHDGRLMADVLAALTRDHPEVMTAAEVMVIEPLATRREVQRAVLGASAGIFPPGSLSDAGLAAVAWVDSFAALESDRHVPTLIFANELLDALPVARWRFDGREWHRLAVGLDADGTFAWHVERVPGFRLPGVAVSVQAALPAGYETETCPGLGGWMEGVAAAVACGRLLIFDYGREADDYYAPHRTAGTLRGYRDHRRCDDPLAAPGATDLTADVNFSHLAEVVMGVGWHMHPPERQGRFLTRLATPRLLASPAPNAAWRRQFQTLTHPNYLGHMFHAAVMETPGLDSPPHISP